MGRGAGAAVGKSSDAESSDGTRLFFFICEILTRSISIKFNLIYIAPKQNNCLKAFKVLFPQDPVPLQRNYGTFGADLAGIVHV